MKLCSIELDGKQLVGAKMDGGIANLTAIGFPAQMNDVINGGSKMLAQMEAAIVTNCQLPIISYDQIKFLPVTVPSKIICKGMNYKDHAQETGGTVPEHPVFFSKFNDTLSAHESPVTLPSWQRCYDYEAEIVMVISKDAYNISVGEAADCIFGYTCGNDMSARDCQFLSTQWLTGKSFPGFAPVGPYIDTDFDPDLNHEVRCEVNGKIVQSGNSSDMIFNCYEIVSAASRYFKLSPGDLIFTGTPAGVILGKKKGERVWLKSGDIVQVTVGGIGTLTTTLI